MGLNVLKAGRCELLAFDETIVKDVLQQGLAVILNLYLVLDHGALLGSFECTGDGSTLVDENDLHKNFVLILLDP